MGFKVKSKGTDFDDLSASLRKTGIPTTKQLRRFGEETVSALKDATPKDTSDAANSWKYEITKTGKNPEISIYNDATKNGIPVVTLLDSGHVGPNGTWVPGSHFIERTVDPIVEDFEEKLTKEGSK